MLKLQTNPTFRAAVGISVAGQPRPATIEIEYRYFTAREWADYIATNAKSVADSLVEDIVVGWAKVDRPFSAEALRELFDKFPAATQEVWEAFLNELFAAKQKN
jgi:hypothetical protein